MKKISVLLISLMFAVSAIWFGNTSYQDRIKKNAEQTDILISNSSNIEEKKEKVVIHESENKSEEILSLKQEIDDIMIDLNTFNPETTAEQIYRIEKAVKNLQTDTTQIELLEKIELIKIHFNL